MPSPSRGNSPLLALPGVLAILFSLAIGLLALLTSLASFGRQEVYGYTISPGAGGILFIHLALAGMVGMAIHLGSRKGASWLQMLLALTSLFSLVLFARFQEWAGCFFLIIIAAAAYYSSLRMKGTLLFLFSGLIGFLIAQLAITTLPYGWKTWAIPGVLFVLAGLIALLEDHLALLPGMGQGTRSSSASRLFYALLCSLIAIAAIALLMQVPHDAGPGLESATRSQAELFPDSADGEAIPASVRMGVGNAGAEDGCNCWNRSSHNPDVLDVDQSCQGTLPWAKITCPEDVRTFPQGESILFQAWTCEEEPCQYLWWSDRDGILSSNRSFSSNGLTVGWHTITLTVTNASPPAQILSRGHPLPGYLAQWH